VARPTFRPVSRLSLWHRRLASGSELRAQNMMRHVDLTPPEMTDAELARAGVEQLISQSGGGSLDLSGKRLSDLDLSALNLQGANLRLARLDGTKLVRADLSGANLDQAWVLGADFTETARAGKPSRHSGAKSSFRACGSERGLPRCRPRGSRSDRGTSRRSPGGRRHEKPIHGPRELDLVTAGDQSRAGRARALSRRARMRSAPTVRSEVADDKKTNRGG
jgi:uncharacterized protein YjbI with pentapeptide repeats